MALFLMIVNLFFNIKIFVKKLFNEFIDES